MSEEIKDLFVSYTFFPEKSEFRAFGNGIFPCINKMDEENIRELESQIETVIRVTNVIILNWQRIE